MTNMGSRLPDLMMRMRSPADAYAVLRPQVKLSSSDQEVPSLHPVSALRTR